MRAVALLLLLASVPLVAAHFAGPVAVTLDLATGDIAIAPPALGYKAMADACSTASPAVASCTGALSPHDAQAPPPGGWLQALLYPREIVSVEGGSFTIAIAWESGTVGARCAVPPTAQDPGALFGIVCEDFGPFASHDWRDEASTLQGSQDATVVGGIQYTVLYAQ